SFNPEEIATMLVEYEKDYNTGMNIGEMSEEIYSYTSGYPFLVSKLCKTIDERLEKNWSLDGIQEAIKIMLDEKNTLFDDLIKNLENNGELYKIIYSVLVESKELDYNRANPTIDKAVMYGIINDKNKKIKIHNKIFEIYIYNYMVSKIETSRINISDYNFRYNYINEKTGDLEIEEILQGFQKFIKENYSNKDERFYESQGRLLLIAFVKPIINGTGFYFIEPQISYEKRMDMVITYNKKKYILEFKRWRGEKYHEAGLEQLKDYLESQSLREGYLVVFNFNKGKEYTKEWVDVGGKKIYEVIV
ncbi:MAG TPA: AAA family ATPase, partial [Clostridiales bacterium]|nr:AAA family ATPase [Clostridiales bacterium]